jgi:tetratricopeptide (TPR) repeat protein
LPQRPTLRSNSPSEAPLGLFSSTIALYAAALGIALLIYLPSLRGPFLSDDIRYLTRNPQVQAVTVENLLEILDPTGDLSLRIANYAPLHLLAHMAEWTLFGESMPAYHLVNVALHALVVVLLIALLRDSDVPPRWALLAGALFLVHPANVEAVAWISQLKTLLAMALLLVALRVRRRRPVAGGVAFVLALLAKAVAAVALPVALLLEWARGRAGGAEGSSGPRWRDLVAWGAALAAFAAVEFWALGHAQIGNAPISEDGAVRVWNSLAIAARYLVMAATSYGVSAFHQPGVVTSPLDPWVVGALAMLALLGARSLWALIGRREEAAWWAWAAISFLPVSQITPFVYPIADRYLYFILPGLLGGALLAGRDLLAPLAGISRAGQLARAGEVAVLCLGIAFAWQSSERAALWTSERLLLADTIRHYPDGPSAHYAKAREAAAWGDPAAAVAHLRQATARGEHGLEQLFVDPGLAAIRPHPDFRQLARQLARQQIEEMGRASRLTEPNRIKLAEAHLIAGEPERAVEVLEEILAAGGDFEAAVRALLVQARAAAAREAR